MFTNTCINNILFNLSDLKIPLIVFLSAVALILIICFIITLIIFKKAFGRRKEIATEINDSFSQYRQLMQEGAKYFFSLNPIDVTVISNDGLKLHGYFYKNPKHRGTVIFMHGYHGEPTHDFGPVLYRFKDLGFSLLLPDQRAHGKSEGKYLTFGVKESEDCLIWANYIASQFPNSPISLHGISMGGATVGMASALDLPKEVKIIANDCGFTSPDAIISSVRRSLKLPKFPFQYFIRFWAKVLGKFSLKQKNAADCYAKTTLPCLFIHGMEDDFVPYYMGIENYEKCASKEKLMITVENAGHGLAYITNPEEVAKKFIEFYIKYMV